MRRKVLLSSAVPLPENFAQQLLDLEASLQLSNSLDSLRPLLQLYSVIPTQQAIEYYESISDAKHHFYQEKMKETLVKHNTLLIKSSSQPNSPKSKDLSQHRRADKSIKEHEVDSSRLSRQISLNLHNQDSNLTLKLRSRQSKLNSPTVKSCKNQTRKSKTFRFEVVSSESESDKSAGFGISGKIEFEDRIEDVVEKFVKEKHQKGKEIRKKYKEEIGEVLKMKGGELIDRIVENMKRNMKEEIEEAEGKIEDERRLEIVRIKEELKKSRV